MKPLLVAEDITARRGLFHVFGVRWMATRYAWMSPLSWAGLGFAMALPSQRDGDVTTLAGIGLWYGAVLYASNVVHSLGHIISGRAANAPVDAVVLTSTRDVIIYAQPGGAAPPCSRIGRALGGPIANVAAGCVLILAGYFSEMPSLTMAGVVNVGIGVWTLVPVPTLDGWVIWRRGL